MKWELSSVPSLMLFVLMKIFSRYDTHTRVLARFAVVNFLFQTKVPIRNDHFRVERRGLVLAAHSATRLGRLSVVLPPILADGCGLLMNYAKNFDCD